MAFYKKKQARRGGDPRNFTESMKISPAEGTSLILFISVFNAEEVAQSLRSVSARDETLLSLTLSWHQSGIPTHMWTMKRRWPIFKN